MDETVNSPGNQSNLGSVDSDGSPDPIPKWKAMFNIFLNRRRRAVLADSGASFSCMSYEYFLNNPHLKKSFVPYKACGTAINGSDVISVGDVRLQF